ncbi:hypothetical protein RUM43_010876 [Polyplax serrata]|uniref:RCC1-like domain-containing protein n=1 Tax=Polyplax serrata TaxID=468196 RepID=A0AAN8S3D9_POLSC
MSRSDEYEIPDTGAVFTFGRSRFAENLSSHFFVRNDPVLEISCGDEHTALVCESGRVFLFGKNDYGQLGFGHTKVVNKPSCLKYLKPFQSIHVACGKGHTIVSTACCRLFTFGCNSDGQLGLGDLENKTVPQLVSTGLSDEDSIVAVAAGCHHSAFLTGKGELYLWGSNTEGQCKGKEVKNVLRPQKLEFAHPITTVSCGYYHTAYISNGHCYTLGEADNGKLGRPTKSPGDDPEKVEISEKCAFVKCGGNHTIIQTESGKAFAFGSNFSGQLGIGSSESEFSVPQPVKFPDENVKLVQLSCGESHSAFVTDQGVLYTCGDARYGKLCNEDDLINLKTPTVSHALKNYFCTSAHCGGCHTMVIAKASNSGSDSTASIRTVLPPLKLKKDSVQETEKNYVTETVQNEPSISVENKNEQDEVDNKSNTESNLNEDMISHESEIYTEVKEIKKEDVTYKREIVEEKSLSLHENGNDLVIDNKEESKIKKFLKRFKGKMKNSVDENKGENEGINSSGNFVGHQTSKACNIL